MREEVEEGEEQQQKAEGEEEGQARWVEGDEALPAGGWVED